MHWLEEARGAGARLIEGRVVAVELEAGRVAAVEVSAGARLRRLRCDALVNAAGPFADEVARLVGVELPLFHELHRKVLFDDSRGAVPRRAPLVIWNDPVRLDWSAEERAALAEDASTAALLGEIPAGVHFRPEGGEGSRSVILLWNYHCDAVERRYPLPEDPLHVPVVVRGIARLLPAFGAYAEQGPRPYVDGGYYTKTRENRPLIGPCGPPGSYLIGALSGFGVMASAAAGELLAAHLTGAALPAWAPAFRLERYEDSGYLRALAGAEQGQL
jgi:glycine/D-amino acid oxidase-like deaminating enzyme